MCVGKTKVSFCACGPEHSCWFLNKAKRKVKKQLPEKTKQMGPVPANRTSKSGNIESIFPAAVELEKVLLRCRSKDEGWGLEKRRTSQPFAGFLFQRFFSSFFSAVEWSSVGLHPRVQGQNILIEREK